MYPSFHNLPACKSDAKHAAQIARGFGIKEENIIYLCDMPMPEVLKTITALKRRIAALGAAGKRTFLFSYAAGHGVADQQ